MKHNGLVVSGFCYGQQTMTPQWRRSMTLTLIRDARTTQRIVGELAHEVSGVHIPDARCAIVREFLAHEAEPEWLWLTDTDATFADDALERLLAAADGRDRPIVGALAFGVRIAQHDGNDIRNGCGASPLELFPTIYTTNVDGTVNRIENYPLDELVQCHSTGAHCLLIHRRVLADARWRDDGHPLPWFRTAVANGKVVSEDQFFCWKAGSFGYPIYVDSRVKTGHVKTFIADEDAYLAQRRGALVDA